MNTMNLTRRQYDSLVTHHAEFMRTVWPKMSKTWHLSGVSVIGTTEQVKQVRDRLSALERIASILS